MTRFIHKRSSKAGLPPGSLVHIGKKPTVGTRITVIDYNLSNLEEKTVKRVEECFALKAPDTRTWINVTGIHETEIVEQIAKHFDIHPLVMEDIVNTGQRPKVEDFDDYLYIVLKMLYYDEEEGEVRAEQLSLILVANYVITFQEQEGDVFNPVRERIRNAKGRIRKMGSDYLAYALIDSIVDNYFIILEKLGEDIEALEEELVTDPGTATLQAIHGLKSEMIFLRKSVWPLREMISMLNRGESALIKESTGVYLRDVYDHTIQAIDTIETFRDMISGMLDIYLSSVSNRMNEVMKVLTIFAAIFIPLTFIAGLYGMNFNVEKSPYNMPELNWYFGYPMALGLMAFVGVAMLIFFRRKKWL